MADTVKRCSKCGDEKPLVAFSKDATRPGGLHPQCKPCRASTGARHYANNKTAISAQRAEFRAAHPEVMRQHQKMYLSRHRATHRAVCATWERADRARQYGAPGRGVTREEWDQILADSLGLCAYCGQSVPLTMDHVEPLSRGGPHEPENVAAACRRCNASKADTPLVLWMAARALRSRAA